VEGDYVIDSVDVQHTGAARSVVTHYMNKRYYNAYSELSGT